MMQIFGFWVWLLTVWTFDAGGRTPWANMWWAISTGIGYFFGNAAVIAFSP